jgi:malonate transporter and related proteins
VILTATTVVLPVFFVLALGYFAGRARKFDPDQVAGLNELVLDYALPAMLFVATVKTPRERLLSEGAYALALLIAIVGLFLVVVLVSTRILHHSLGEAALQANLASYPSVAFFGPPIFQGLFGASSLLSIAFAATLSGVSNTSQLRDLAQSAARIFGWDNNDKPGVQLNQQLVISQEQLEQIRQLRAVPEPEPLQERKNNEL